MTGRRFPLEFVTIAVSDGISMGHEGMRASLVSREVIADSVETVMHAERFDGLVTFAGCDKSLPGMLMAAARVNLPSVFLYGGSILPGRLRDRALDVVSVFEAVGANAVGELSDEELGLIERNACPTVGSCAGMFTANTMASVAEALGMSLPGSASVPAVVGASTIWRFNRDKRWWNSWRGGDPTPSHPHQGGLRERHCGGHGPRGFDQRRAPPLGHRQRGPGGSRARRLQQGGCTGAPSGRHQATRPVPHVRRGPIGGVPVVLRELLEAGLLHGDVLTVTGRTMAQISLLWTRRHLTARWSTH